jgi:hypothetical protein
VPLLAKKTDVEDSNKKDEKSNPNTNALEKSKQDNAAVEDKVEPPVCPTCG